MKVLVKLCSSAPSHQGRRLGCAPLCLLEFMGTKEKKGTSQAEHMQEMRGWWRLRVWHELKGSSRGLEEMLLRPMSAPAHVESG